MWGGVAGATGSVGKGVAEQESWAGWVWRVASRWLGSGAVIKLWVGFWSQSLLAKNKGPRHHCPRGKEGAEGRGSSNPEPSIRLSSWPLAGQGALQSGGHRLVGGFSEGLQSETEGPVLMAEVERTSQQVTKGSQSHGTGVSQL